MWKLPYIAFYKKGLLTEAILYVPYLRYLPRSAWLRIKIPLVDDQFTEYGQHLWPNTTILVHFI